MCTWSDVHRRASVRLLVPTRQLRYCWRNFAEVNFAWLTLVMGFSLLLGVAHSILHSANCSKNCSLISIEIHILVGSTYQSWLCSFHLSWLLPLTTAVVVCGSLWKVLPSSETKTILPWRSSQTLPQRLCPYGHHPAFAAGSLLTLSCACKLHSSDNDKLCLHVTFHPCPSPESSVQTPSQAHFMPRRGLLVTLGWPFLPTGRFPLVSSIHFIFDILFSYFTTEFSHITF